MKSELATILLKFSDDQLDASMKAHIEKWSDPPKAIEILEVLDHCIYGSLASGFVVKALQTIYNSALSDEGKTHEEMAQLASWRRELE